jgi:ADP-ribose pyrophosphatase YjhB (NUDIX family)
VLLLFKSHVKGYTRADGTYVPPHETKVVKKAPAPQKALFDHKAPLPAEAYAGKDLPAAAAPKSVASAHMEQIKSALQQPKAKKWVNSLHSGKQFGKDSAGESKGAYQGGLFGGHKGYEKEKPHYPNAITHPQAGDKGEPIQINEPSKPSLAETWEDPDATATFVPGSAVPRELNGVAMQTWADAPTTDIEWNNVPGQDMDLEEPEFILPKGKKAAAGVIIEEPDGRVWLLRPTNGFGGYDATFPKGRIDPGIGMQASAIKEAFEETGLQVEITGFVCDIERSVTMARFYRARRVGGTPKDMGWEAQAVQLVPKDELHQVLNTEVDRHIAKQA